MLRIGILACALLLTATAQAADKLPPLNTAPNLAGWWKFDETAGIAATDSSRHQRSGVLKGDVEFEKASAPGRISNAIRLDGKDAMIEIPKYKGVTGTRPRTVSVWIKTAAAQGEILSWGEEDFGRMFTIGFIRGRIGITHLTAGTTT